MRICLEIHDSVVVVELGNAVVCCASVDSDQGRSLVSVVEGTLRLLGLESGDQPDPEIVLRDALEDRGAQPANQ